MCYKSFFSLILTVINDYFIYSLFSPGYFLLTFPDSFVNNQGLLRILNPFKWLFFLFQQLLFHTAATLRYNANGKRLLLTGDHPDKFLSFSVEFLNSLLLNHFFLV